MQRANLLGGRAPLAMLWLLHKVIEATDDPFPKTQKEKTISSWAWRLIPINLALRV